MPCSDVGERDVVAFNPCGALQALRSGREPSLSEAPEDRCLLPTDGALLQTTSTLDRYRSSNRRGSGHRSVPASCRLLTAALVRLAFAGPSAA